MPRLERSPARRLADEAKTYVHGYFTLDGLDALAAGGRIPPAAASLSSKLDIKPELSFDLAGSLSLIGVNRGRKKALKSLVKSFRENYELDPTLPLTIVSSDARRTLTGLRPPFVRSPVVRTSRSCADRWGPPSVRTLGRAGGTRLLGQEPREKISLTDRIANRVRGE